MGPTATFRAMQAAERRLVREAQRRHREYERQAKERIKLSAMEQARLEVQFFESQIDLLLSVHKECSETWDWIKILASLPPPEVVRYSANETKTKLQSCLPFKAASASCDTALNNSRANDDQIFNSAKRDYAQSLALIADLKQLGRRILSGEHKSYTDALVGLNPFAELSSLGSSLHFTVHTATFAECNLKVNGKQAIPSESKSLTASGSVSIKPMPKTRFQEIYSDYICGCLLRVAREMFALLPLEFLLVTATADYSVESNEQIEVPVLSVFFSRHEFSKIDFEQPHAYDLIDQFQHRGNFKLSRRSEAFQPIIPLSVDDLSHQMPATRDVTLLVADIRRVRNDMEVDMRRFNPAAEPVPSTAI